MLLTISAVICTALFVLWQLGVLLPKSSAPLLPSDSTSTSLLPAVDGGVDMDCEDFFDQDDAQKYFVAQGGSTADPDNLDLDKNGLACDDYLFPSATPTSDLATTSTNVEDEA